MQWSKSKLVHGADADERLQSQQAAAAQMTQDITGAQKPPAAAQKKQDIAGPQKPPAAETVPFHEEEIALPNRDHNSGSSHSSQVRLMAALLVMRSWQCCSVHLAVGMKRLLCLLHQAGCTGQVGCGGLDQIATQEDDVMCKYPFWHLQPLMSCWCMPCSSWPKPAQDGPGTSLHSMSSISHAASDVLLARLGKTRTC